jgi:hypothetical protein
MFALITPRAYSRKSKDADKAAAVLYAKQACGGPPKAEMSSSFRTSNPLGCSKGMPLGT